MQQVIKIQSYAREELIDITDEVRKITHESGIKTGIISVFAQGATAAIMIQENWDASVRTDTVNLLKKLVPRGIWIHDKEDGNGDSHLKAGLIGPSETIPVINGDLGLSTWQNIFFCEFDGPRKKRTIVCNIVSSDN